MHGLGKLICIVTSILAIVILGSTLNLIALGAPTSQYGADLVGEKEILPVFSESNGRAIVIGNVSKLWYQVNVSSLDRVTGVSLYKGDETENGEVLVSLLNLTKPTGIINGVLAQGIIDSSSLQGPVKNLTSLIELINQNLTYVNIHTSKFPEGELRGTLAYDKESVIPVPSAQPEDWSVACYAVERWLTHPCSAHLNPDGTLTQEGNRAKDCILGGALLSGASLAVSRGTLPTRIIIDGLAFLAPRNGCGDIVDFVKLKQATDPSSFFNALGIPGH
jgi:CHRD domain